MDFILDFLYLCSFMALLNLIGVSPQFVKPIEYFKGASLFVKILLGTYVSMCFIGGVTIAALIVWLFFR